MIVWADGGWDYSRCVGYAAVFREGLDDEPVALPVLRGVSTSLMCEYEALVLAIRLTPDDPSTLIRSDSRSVVDQISGAAGCAVVELASYIGWVRRHLGRRGLEWAPREENKAHFPVSRLFDADESWGSYELEALRERRRVDRRRAKGGALGHPEGP